MKAPMQDKRSILVFVPTYNEKENVRILCQQILALGIELDILFMDDHSPDGTGQVVEDLSKLHPQVHAIHRSGKLGVGSAHFSGIQYAYENGYSHLITMDCDFTHPPRYILDLLQVADDSDVVVGSRYLQSKSLVGWNLIRKFLTHTGHFLTRILLKMPYDATGGFRLYRLDKIPRYAFNGVASPGYSFFFESLFVLYFNQFKVREIPIILPSRTYGHSKMSYKEIWNSIRLLFSIYFTTLLNREKLMIYKTPENIVNDGVEKDDQGWDDYWKDQKETGGFVYDLIAAFYRKFIIKRNLNYFIKKYFRPGERVLHAGCGSGQVDRDIRNYVSITGMDISVNALSFYSRTNPGFCQVLHGSIFNVPLKGESIDGIYNLGVMEHFTSVEIDQILAEFHRVLKPNGKMVIFWPPEFGASVIFLKGVKWILENIFKKKNVKLHPDEITRVQSREHVVDIFKKDGFQVLEYYFGIRDLFTYSIICVKKVEKSESIPRSKISPKEVTQAVPNKTRAFEHNR